MLRDRYAQIEVKRPIGDAVIMLTGSEGWSDHELKYLTIYTENDFLEWLKTTTDSRLLRRLKTFRERFGENPQGKPIVARLDEALRQLGKRSEVDARRVRDGIGISSDEREPE